MKKQYIDTLDLSTEPAAAFFLVGGFEVHGESKTHKPPLHIFQTKPKEVISKLCKDTEAGCRQSRRELENILMILLNVGGELQYHETRYIFNINNFSCQKAMNYLVREVLAQVNEE